MEVSRVFLKAPGEKRRRPPAGVQAFLHLDETGLPGYPIHHNLNRLLAGFEAPTPQVLGFLLTAVGVWAADKLTPRRERPDAWTRSFELHLPVSPTWISLAPRLGHLLNFLTGDFWELKVREARLGSGERPCREDAWQPEEVVLFSGGLDSLSGAIHRLEAKKRLLLVSHYDFGQLASVQQSLAAALKDHYGAGQVRHLPCRVQFPEATELTLRSRSLLYLALGLAAADCFGAPLPVLIPENGWISLNPPLTGNRLGPYSTRTTHPYFLAVLAGLWQEAGIKQPLANPYRHLTKGELLATCPNPELLRRLIPASISCSRPVVGRWQGGSLASCGYCYPCLMRRAALHRLGWDRGEEYRLDVLTDGEILKDRLKGRDLRALLLALQTWEEDPAALEARLGQHFSGDGTTPASEPQARRVLEAGFAEIGAFFREQGPKWLTAYLD